MTGRAAPVAIADSELIDAYVALGATPAARRNRHAVGRRFNAHFGSIDGWHQVSVAERLAAPVVLRSYVSFAVVAAGCAVDADYVVGTPTKWALHVGEREPLAQPKWWVSPTSSGSPRWRSATCGRRCPSCR